MSEVSDEELRLIAASIEQTPEKVRPLLQILLFLGDVQRAMGPHDFDAAFAAATPEFPPALREGLLDATRATMRDMDAPGWTFEDHGLAGFLAGIQLGRELELRQLPVWTDE